MTGTENLAHTVGLAGSGNAAGPQGHAGDVGVTGTGDLEGRPVVFLGPTLPVAEANELLDAVYLPPAAQGDLYRAALHRPAAIGLVDGYFAGVPAVWHKEILWALEQGIPIYGASSMGALRAAELAPFGMAGVGAIFAGFRDGELVADDEVAVAHGPAESGYRAISEALVTIRATLAAARSAGILDGPTADVLLGLARGRHYPQRSFPQLLADATERGLPPEQLGRLREWLPTGRVDAKRADALELLVTMRRHLATSSADPRADSLADSGVASPADPGVPVQREWTMEQTQVWAHAVATAGTGEEPAPLVADELRLCGQYRRVYLDALLRHLMLDTAARLRLCPSATDVHAAAERLRALGVRRDLDRLARENASLRLVEAACYPHTVRRVPDQVRASAEYGAGYPAIADAVRRKAGLLAERAGRLPSVAELGLDVDELVARHFRARGLPVPTDLAGYARRTGFASPEAFRRALVLDLLDRLHHPGPDPDSVPEPADPQEHAHVRR